YISANFAPVAAHGSTTFARSRFFLKVQDGCNHRCTYCIVWRTRGASRSEAETSLIERARRAVSDGYGEIVLTGVDLGAFGRDRGLKRMGRLYRRRDYLNLVAALRSQSPELAVTADVIVGFPGETDADFADTENIAAEAGLSGMHVFRYSPRAGTAAPRLGLPVDDPVSKERSHRLQTQAEAQRRAYEARFVDRELEVIWDRRYPTRMRGLSDNYITVYAPARGQTLGALATIRPVASCGDGLLGAYAVPVAEDCLFCKIFAREIPAKEVFREDDIVAFEDIRPVAPTHVLVIPKVHIPSVHDLTRDQAPMLARMMEVANRIADERKVDRDGYRLVFNKG